MIGFSSEVRKETKEDKQETLQELLPQDLLKFGLIPEFVGRLPIVATLKDLDKEALLDIIIKPKNSLIKQYKKLFEMDNVELSFEDGALDAVVERALERKTGARGLRAILEEIMKDIMFEIPSNPNITKCIITKETIESGTQPKLVFRSNNVAKSDLKVKRKVTNKSEETA